VLAFNDHHWTANGPLGQDRRSRLCSEGPVGLVATGSRIGRLVSGAASVRPGPKVASTHQYVLTGGKQERRCFLPTNLALDDKLIEEARKLGEHKTQKETVTAALKEYVQRRRQVGILEMVGKVEYWDDYDHKKLRQRRAR